MKEEWKVYIKGVPNRGNEVIKALTDLGAKEGFYTKSGSDDNIIHFINHKGEIDYEYLDSESGQIIMDNYHELKLPEKWKDGNILINNDGSDYKVFWEYDSDSDTSFYAHNVSMDVNGTLTQYSGSIWHGEKIVCFIEDYRLASNSEVKRFHKLLNKCGKDWDGEKKQLVDFKWKPKQGEAYYYVDCTGDVCSSQWKKEPDDLDCYNFGNCFRTSNEAEVMAKKIKNLFNTKL